MFMKSFLSAINLFDFSNYPKDSNFFDETTKKAIRKIEDEFGGVIVDEFVALKSKMFSIKILMAKTQILLKE